MATVTKNQLIIYLHDNHAEKVSWIIKENDERNQTPNTGILANIKNDVPFDQVIVLVPSTEILITPVTLPAMSSAQQTQAALYVLEEQLVEDVQKLHAIVMPLNQQKNSYTVAILRKSLIKEWLETLQQNNIIPTILLPDIFALPVASEGWSVLLHKNLALVRTGPKTGFSIESENLAYIMADLPPRIELRNYTNEPPPDLLNNTGTQIIPTNHLNLESFLLTQEFSSEENLLSGEFTSAFDKAHLRKRWKIPVILGLILLLLYTTSAAAKWLYLTHENNILQEQISGLYQQVFPNATSVISPKLRIQQELQTKEKTLKTDDFLYLLAQAGNALAKTTAIKLQSISFQDEELILTVQSKKISDFDTLQTQLKKQGIQYEQKETSSTNTGVNAQFHIKRAAS